MAKAKITRIKANDSKKADTNAAEPVITRKKVVLKDKKAEQKDKKAKKQAEKKAVKEKSGKKPFILIRPFSFIGRYFRDSWREIRQVRWPNRKATWKMVFAVLVYTAIFVVLLVLLDMLFKFIFNQILG